MASNNSTSQLAALAAFNATNNKKKEEPQPSRSRVPLKVDTTAPSQTQKKALDSATRAKSSNQIAHVQTDKSKGHPLDRNDLKTTPTNPNVTNTFKAPKTPRTPQISRSVETPNSVGAIKRMSTYSNSFAAESLENDPPRNDYFGQPLSTLENPERRKTISQQSLNYDPQDMIRNVKNSIGSKYISNDLSPGQVNVKRLSTGTQPKDMLDLVRNSINSKAKSNSKSQEMSQRNALLLSGIRDSIDSKRISSHHDNSTVSLPLAEERDKIINLISKSNNPEEQLLLYGKPIYNYSSSSFGSSFLEHDNDQLRTPVIVRTDMDLPDPEGNASIQYDERENYSHGEDDIEYNDTSDTKIEEKEVSPINIPLSLHACARLGIGNNETSNTFMNLKIQTPDKDDSSKLKPKRKPPPDMDAEYASPTFTEQSDDYQTDGDDQFSDTSSNQIRRRSMQYNDYSRFSDTSSRSQIKINDDSDYSYFDESDLSGSETPSMEKLDNDKLIGDDKLPIFPDIKAKSRKLFRHKKSKPIYYLDDPDTSKSDLQSATEELKNIAIPSRTSTPVMGHQPQPVQLKATMRTSKKREKKYSFNENKPWKNHNELSFITELERKRYEGLWTSNKGLYVNSAVTRFIGVDYNGKPDIEQQIENQDPSTAAALLSSRATNEDNPTTVHQNFHNLLSAETSQLIHGVVVRRIWKRSRLPKQTLEAIWDLVDFRKDGTLNRPEFLVGMWLVDQCLYGRKLPKKVDNTVWNSLGNVGLNVVLKKKGRR
ncbi:Increased rDNA silencing protein 4 [Debaryomyces fabryi]|uniref:Increased rDNA silencing protein 4 n=1 Tax=Debaryomyces fabryi TaxID=58627 RepID=A0A0V1PVC8_9ASCO|nr:Increased rDNA silencing protein 4 [Debaryomyces fabryi]KSA00144.1 Increased rDNA silencing protein 4 [Debaryomyces fabryi]CUM47824.1 unnamed protein product [Debaryomyces fabryi]